MKMKHYYTAKEAQERLGMDSNAFYYRVSTEEIKKYVPPGKTQGVYPKFEVDRYARERAASMIYDEKVGLQFAKATTDEDYQDEHELGTRLFGNALNNMETRTIWRERNADLDFIIRDHGRLVGFINLLPAKHDAIMQLMNGEIKGRDIQADDVLPFTPGNTIECIIMGIATLPDFDISRRTQYGAKLLSGLRAFLIQLAEKKITITKFYAASATPSGITILRHAGFKELRQSGKRIAFELDVMTAKNRLLAEYRQALDNKKP
jgi:hypothetical protein